jgi:hypothetical protein
MTNYERIKNMSVEEMAEIINVLTRCCATDECHECQIDEFKENGIVCSKISIKQWLEREVDNNAE